MGLEGSSTCRAGRVALLEEVDVQGLGMAHFCSAAINHLASAAQVPLAILGG